MPTDGLQFLFEPDAAYTDGTLAVKSAGSAQTSGSSVTLIPAIAAASAPGDVELECVETSPLGLRAPRLRSTATHH